MVDADSKELLSDEKYERSYPMNMHRSGEVYRPIEGQPRNLLVYIWYYSAFGRSLVNEDQPWTQNMSGLRPWRMDQESSSGHGSSSSTTPWTGASQVGRDRRGAQPTEASSASALVGQPETEPKVDGVPEKTAVVLPKTPRHNARLG